MKALVFLLVLFVGSILMFMIAESMQKNKEKEHNRELQQAKDRVDASVRDLEISLGGRR